MPDLSLIFNLSSLHLLFYLYPLVEFYSLVSNTSATDLEIIRPLLYLSKVLGHLRTNDTSHKRFLYDGEPCSHSPDNSTYHWKREQELTLYNWP